MKYTFYQRNSVTALTEKVATVIFDSNSLTVTWIAEEFGNEKEIAK